MATADDNLEGLGELEPATAGVEVAPESVAAPAASSHEAARTHRRDHDRIRAQHVDELDEERRRDLQVSFNRRISHLCTLVALVISVVTFATVVLGQDNLRFVILGLSLSVALLAIALLQDFHRPKP